MNRNRTYWSAMGVEPIEERALSEKELRERLKHLVEIWGFDEVVTVLRKIREEE